MTSESNSNSFHTFGDDALGYSDATELADRLRRGDCSANDVLQASLARAHRAQPVLRGLTGLIPESPESLPVTPAPSKTKPAGRFQHVPTAIKDNTDVEKFPTNHGTAALKPDIAKHTSPFAQQMLAQGFTCIGKSSMPEFGFNATTEPAHDQPTRNPWHTDYSSGASSGGAAALVAAGVVPIAHANDGGGSIRIPAACCGLVGLKPSRGRLIDNDAAKSLPINIVADGVVTRTVRDTANFFAAAEGYFKNDRLPAIGQVSEGPGRPLRIGLVLDSISGHATDQATRAAVEQTARILEKQGHKLEPIPIPVADSFPADFALYWAMLAFGVRKGGKRLFHGAFDHRQVDGLTQGLDAAFRKQFYRLPAALWRLKRSYHDYAKAIAGFDAVLTPTLGHTTPELGHLSPNVPFEELFERLFRFVGFTPLANTSGAPAISLPGGVTTNGLPIGVHFMGRHGGERTLLELAFELEQAQPWPMLWQRASG